MLRIAVPRLARHVSLQPRRIPHFYSLVIRCRDKEHVVRRYGKTRDRICVRVEMCNEIRLWALMRPVARNEAVSTGGAAADRPLVHFRPEVALQILASVEVHMF